jgi:hypothetical protein
MKRTQDVRKNDERVRTLAADIIKATGQYAAKKRAAGHEMLRNTYVFSVTSLQRVIKPRRPSQQQPYPRMEEVREGKVAWIIGTLRHSGNAKQLCIDPEGHGYIVDAATPRIDPEQLTVTMMMKMNESQLEEIYGMLVRA